MKLILLIFLWFWYFPIQCLVRTIFSWLPPIKKRLDFEKKNLNHQVSLSFKAQELKADFCFEFSSEGEYQQVASLIDDALTVGKRIELIFFSPSVEKTIISLALKYPDQLRVLRYPLLQFGTRHSLRKWITASELILVRYDLFPEILLWAKNPQHKLIMLWMSFKKERIGKREVSWFKKEFLKQASKIIYAASSDADQGLRLGLKGSLYDFRLEQIRRRLTNRDLKFKADFKLYPDLVKLMELYPKPRRLILGNAWPSDLKLLTNLPSDIFLMIVPHQLSENILSSMRTEIHKFDPMYVELTEISSEIPATRTILLNKKGVLCELYSDFGHSYVGGGFEGSIHSVLEPLVSGSDQIACGPAHHRSTEYDICQSFGAMTEIKSSQELLDWLHNQKSRSPETQDKLNDFVSHYPKFRREVISC